MRSPLFLFVLIVSILTLSAGTPFSKPVRKPGNSSRKASSESTESPSYDTIVMPSRDSVAVAGFEKTLRSSHESMYVSNLSSTDIAAVALEIIYSDTKGRMLHKNSHEVSADIPAGETRLIEVPSFDRQGLYYYYLSPAPARARQATPFRVEVKVNYILTLPPASE